MKKFFIVLYCFVLCLTFMFSEVLSWKSNEGTNIQILNIENAIIKDQSSMYETRTITNEIEEAQKNFAAAKSTLPHLQGILYFPSTNLNIGDVWENDVEIEIPFLFSDQIETFQITSRVRYTLREPMFDEGRQYQRVTASWMPFFIVDKKTSELTGLSRIAGLSNIDLLWDVKSGSPKKIALQEEVQFIYTDKSFAYFRKETNQTIKTAIEIIREQVASEIQEKITSGNIKDIEVKQADQGLMLSIDNIQFSADSADLLESEKIKLDSVGSLIRNLTKNKIMVVGHAANQAGSDEQELFDLSESRAAAVANYLVNAQIKTRSMIVSKGMGGTEPIATNETPEGRAKNRRVEIIIIDLDIESEHALENN